MRKSYLSWILTFKDLRAQLERLQRSGGKTNDDYDSLLNDSRNIPFWPHQLTDAEHSKLRKDCLTDRVNSTCCFWDLIGRPFPDFQDRYKKIKEKWNRKHSSA